MLRRLFIAFVVSFIGAIFSGCVLSPKYRNTVVIHDVDKAFQQIRSAVLNIIPVGHRAISPNGREFLSLHFNSDGKGGFKPGVDSLSRYYAQILVLNDRRPYNIEIWVTQEKAIPRAGGYTYVKAGYNERLAKNLKNRIVNELSKRPEDSNIIDDFRVF
ncbi:MAG TPA: hypothetical protein PKC28_01025 [Bdellovibrionales bacterium]|nr:hypothetical protein [Bdellovibrionales bacterium]